MMRNRYREEQIIGVLKEHEARMSVADLCRTHGVSDATVYQRKAKFGGMNVSEAKRLKTLEDDDAQLMRLLLVNAILDDATLKDLFEKMVTPSARRQAVAHLMVNHKMSERRACRIIGCCHMSVRYKTVRKDDPVLHDRLNAFAKERRRFGFRRWQVSPRREGHGVNHNRLFLILPEKKACTCAGVEDERGLSTRGHRLRCRFCQI